MFIKILTIPDIVNTRISIKSFKISQNPLVGSHLNIQHVELSQMEKGTLIVVALSILDMGLAQQCQVKKYNTKLMPSCDPNDVRVKWPNYEDQTKYQICAGVGEPQLMSCPNGEVFTYALQACTACANHIPSVECERLATQYPPRCISIEDVVSPQPEILPLPSSTNGPTTHYTTSLPGEGSGNGIEDETTDDPHSSTIPPPPSPSPLDPHTSSTWPTPPTAEATPPLIQG